jgi:accessory gene regulator protein AgrB
MTEQQIDPATAAAETQPFDMEEFRARQKARSRIMGVALLALAALFFLITIAKLSLNH